MTYKAVIFDLDGTLVNSLEDLARSANAVLEHLGLPTHDIPSYAYRVGNGIRALMERSLPEGRVDLLEDALALFREEYAARQLVHTAPYKGIRELLDGLRERGIRLAVCTNKHEEAAMQIVERLFGSGLFEVVAGDLPGRERKPCPDTVLSIAARWGLLPEEIVYAGDSGVDMETAVRAGMLPAGVLWGFRGAEELRACGAAVLLQKLADLWSVWERETKGA